MASFFNEKADGDVRFCQKHDFWAIFEHFLKIRKKTIKNQIFKIVKYFICPGQKFKISIFLFFDIFAYMEVWR